MVRQSLLIVCLGLLAGAILLTGLAISSPVNADRPEQGQTPIPTPIVEAGELLVTPGVVGVRRIKLGHRTITLYPPPRDDAQHQPFWRELTHKPFDTPAATQDKPFDTPAATQDKPFDTPAATQDKPPGLDTSGPNLDQLCTSQCGTLGWHKVMTETFEAMWPISPSPWLVRDFSDTDGGEYLWGRRDCRPRQEDFSAWSIGGGADGSLLPCGNNYPNNALTLTTYGPFDLSQATDAQFQFSLWLDTESNFYDLFGYAASRNGEDFEGYARSGDATYWSPVTLDLTDVSELGDLTGEPQVWTTFLFASDFSVNNYEGAFVDDVTIWAYEATAPPPPPTYTTAITLHTTIADFKRGRSDGGIAIQTAAGGELALASQVTTMSTWTRLPNLPLSLNFFPLVAAPYSLLVVGGNTPDSVQESQVYCAHIGPGGELGHWAATSPLPQALMSHAALLENGRLFVIGGSNQDGVQASVFSAPLQDNGALGEWKILPPLPQPRYRHSAVAANGYLFVLGGVTSNEDISDIIYRTPVNADGTLGAWTPLSRTLPVPLEGHTAAIVNDYLFILGGWGGISPGMRDEVYKAAIDPEGNLGPWQSVTPLPQPLWWHAATVAGGGILVSGGLNLDHPSSALQRTVYRATPNANGDIDAWMELSPLPYPIAAHAFAATNDYLYVAGGGQDIRPALGSVLMASLHTSPTAVHQGNFYHQFDLWSSALIKTLYWQETGDQGSIRVRYRVAPQATGEYGAWSEYYATGPIAVNSQGGYLAYQVKAESDEGTGKQVEAIGLTIDRTLDSVYLPLIVRNASTR